MSSTGPEANRFAPPAAHVEDVESASSGQLAGRGTRLVAAIVDGLIIGLAILLVGLITPYNAFEPREDALLFTFVLNLVLGFGAYLLLNGWLLHSRGQTIAKAGQTGTVTAPQVHFEIRKGSTPVDPTQYLNGA